MSEMWVQVSAMMDKEYFRIYYKNHKKESLTRSKKWHQDNPERVKILKEKYFKKLLGKKKTITNRSNYNKGKNLKKLFISRYGKYLEKTKDNITLTAHRKRIFCVDCIYYKRGRILKGCPGWDKCPFKEEILKEIKKKDD